MQPSDKLCEVEIPGVGQCELYVQGHEADPCGMLVHRRGSSSWNGYERIAAKAEKVKVYYEPQHNRWHTTFKCLVIQESADIELVLCSSVQPHWRACDECANVPESCD